MNRISRDSRAAAGIAAATLLAAHGAVAGPPAISLLRYSADTGANIVDANTFAARWDFVDDDLVSPRQRRAITWLPETADLHDFHIDPNEDLLFALDIGLTRGGTYFAPADVVRTTFNGATFEKEFDSVAAGVPGDVHCDGVARWGDTGKLLLSFDKTFTIGGLTLRPADVVVFDAGTFGTKVVDAHALGLPDTANVDATDTFRTKRYVLVSFDSGGTVGGVQFTSADVLQLDRRDGTWSKRYALGLFSDRWDTVNLDGLAAVNIDTVFEEDFD